MDSRALVLVARSQDTLQNSAKGLEVDYLVNDAQVALTQLALQGMTSVR